MISADTNVMKAAQDQRYVALRAAESLGYFGLAHGSFQSPDRNHLFKGQKLLEESDETNIDGVLFVAPIVDPLKVGGSAIRFDSIDVVNDRKTCGIGYEGKSYQSVDVYRFAPSISIQIDVLISELVRSWPENLSIDSSGFKTEADSIQTSNAAAIADLVSIPEVADHNGSPFFLNNDIHTTGCPSGNDGSTIKNPSRASTFGGFAIMAASPDIYNRRLACRFH